MFRFAKKKIEKRRKKSANKEILSVTVTKSILAFICFFAFVALIVILSVNHERNLELATCDVCFIF